jgi:tetratricopeptide (TPR) repeat protein
MAKRLEQIRLRSRALGLDWSGVLEADASFEKAFREYGLDFAKLETEEAVREINRRLIKDDLKAALGDWGDARAAVGKGNDALARRIRAVDVVVSQEYYFFFGEINKALERKGRKLEDLPPLVTALMDEKGFPTLSAHRVHELAMICEMAGASVQAERLLRRLQHVRPGDFWANWHLGLYHVMFAAAPKPGEAVRHFQVARALRPEVEEVRRALGYVLAGAKEHEKALVVFQAACQADPRSAWNQWDLGQAWAALSEPERAAGHYLKALELNGAFPEAHFSLGLARASQGRYEEAVTSFRQALKLSHAFTMSLALRQVEEHLNKIVGPDKGGKEVIDKILKEMMLRVMGQMGHEHGPGGCYIQLGKALWELRKPEDAVTAFRQAVALEPLSGLAAHELSRALIMTGELAAGEVEAKRWLGLGTTHPELPYTASTFHEHVKRMVELNSKLIIVKDPDGKVLSLTVLDKVGEKPSKDANRLSMLVELCEFRKCPVAMWGYYGQLLAIKAEEADRLRYAAITAALRAAAGRGEDARDLEVTERTQYRRLAFTCLLRQAAEIAVRLAESAEQDKALIEQGKGGWPSGSLYSPSSAQIRLWAERQLRQWKQDPDLAIIRDEKALAKLPAEEQKGLREFWAGNEEMLKSLWTDKVTVPVLKVPSDRK